jgi:hypothetical protein
LTKRKHYSTICHAAAKVLIPDADTSATVISRKVAAKATKVATITRVAKVTKVMKVASIITKDARTTRTKAFPLKNKKSFAVARLFLFVF